MAIVKILKSSKRFAAIEYNETRCKNGEAVLLKAGNFSSISNIISYSDYLSHWSSKNSRIKNSQFHATISLEKDELTQEELVDVAEKWLISMGYEGIPYLIYLHTNTNHTHVHIVTSRIDKNGNKVDHNFEKERAVKCLNKILNKTEDKTLRTELSDLLHYSFSTKHQFYELAVSSGFKCKFDEDNIICSKNGTDIVLPLNLIEFCSKRYHKSIDVTNKKKIQGLIYKYASRMTKDSFVPYMRRKFGLQFIFYGKKGDINGYTIIDYKNRSVYKGSEVFGAKKISEFFETSKNISDVDIIVQDIFDANPLCNYDVLRSVLQRDYFYDIDNEFNIIDVSTGEIQHKLDNDFIGKLNYNQKVLLYAERFKPYNDELISIISKVAKVKVSDMKIAAHFEKPSLDILDNYNQTLKDGISSNTNLRDYLEMNHLALVITSNNYYLIDYINGLSISGSDLNVTLDDIKESVKSDDRPVDTLAYNDEDEEKTDWNSYSYLMNTPMLDISGLFFAVAVAGSQNKKKKKKTPGI